MEIQNENNLFKKFKQKMKIESFSKLIGVVILINIKLFVLHLRSKM